MNLETVSRELYGLVPSEFTTARDARVQQARKVGDRTLAASIQRLRRPSIGAWLANLIARHDAEDLDQLIALGDGVRRAQNDLEGEMLRGVSSERHHVVEKLLDDARALASHAGHPVSESALVDLEATLDAAFADPEAAKNVRAGQLTTGLRYSGFGVGLSRESSAAAQRGGSKSAPARDIESAGNDLVRARRDLDQAQEDAARADAEVDKARRAVVVAKRELHQLESAAARAAARAERAHKAAAAAKKRSDKLRRRTRG